MDAFSLNFQRLLAAKLCIGFEHILDVQEWYKSPLSPCQVWWGSDFACRRGVKKVNAFCCFLYAMLSNDNVCERHFTINM